MKPEDEHLLTGPEPGPAQSEGLSEEELNAIDGDLESMFYPPRPSDAQVTRYREIGAQLQTWIDDPNAEGCTVAEATLTMQDLLDDNWTLRDSRFVPSVSDLPETARIMMGLPSPDNGAQLRHMRIERHGGRDAQASRAQVRMPRYNSHSVTTGDGFIVCHRMFRWDGPWWNEIARAFYEVDFPIGALKYVAFMEIVNEQTAPLVVGVHYPRRGIRFATMGVDEPDQVWLHGSREYQEILGTALGKSVAYLILSCFQRGTKRISRILTWNTPVAFSPSLGMLFEIENTA
ncbi:uncharacterized protein N7515_004803 [Penicillium bovifimosum]|uniref:Uncharacterized protein n=1 Tax=Penicillium bovifimosum TaxID=126998 RepID=A0A9W9L2S4_9EURO|nr:uncharacterized protein N7515_004803 [Penicillium bovifimosum]KAJ5135525.1 hypothetical protein N7515_004803 [Penicillium bovifimosum]